MADAPEATPLPEAAAQSDSATQLDAQGEAPTPPCPTTFNILVKNPTDRPGSPPFSIQVDVTSTIHQLKHRLTESYPGAPPVSAQRLIYAGKLLDNRHSLETVLGTVDRTAQHTIHLVVSSLATSSSRSGAASNSSQTPLAASAAPGAGANDNTAGPRPAQTPVNPLLPPGNIGAPYLGPMYPHNMFQGMPMPPVDPVTGMLLPYPMYGFPPPPSDNPNPSPNQTPSTGPPPFTPIDPASYAAHLQAMERVIADTLAANARAATAANAATAQGREAAAQGEQATQAAAAQAAAAQAAAMAIALHTQAHAQAVANYDARVRAQMGNNNVPGQQFPLPGQPPQGGGLRGVLNRANQQHQHNPHNPNPQMEGGPRVRQFVFQFEINWSLITKLILLVYLLGQEGSPSRVYTLLVIAVGIYLWQTNRLGFLRRIASAALPNPAQLLEMLFPQQNAANASEAGGAGTQNGDGESRRAPRGVNRFGRTAVVLSLVYSFFYGFICSLLPAWRPEALPRMEELLNRQGIANGDEGVPAGPGENQAGDGNNHAHVD